MRDGMHKSHPTSTFAPRTGTDHHTAGRAGSDGVGKCWTFHLTGSCRVSWCNAVDLRCSWFPVALEDPAHWAEDRGVLGQDRVRYIGVPQDVVLGSHADVFQLPRMPRPEATLA